MNILDTLITDRTEQDAIRASTLNAKGLQSMTDEEKAFYLSAENKGSYKALDMNRVTEAMVYIADRLREAGIYVAVTARTWADSDVPSAEEYEAYRQNIAAVRAALSVLPGTPEAPLSLPMLTVWEANDIESILLYTDKALDNLAAAYRHCGVTISGLGGIRI